MKFLAAFFILSASFILSSCSTPTRNEGYKPSVPVRDGEYAQVLEYFSAGKAEYNGFYNNFEFEATILNTIVDNAIAEQQGKFYQWEGSKLQSELDRSAQERSSKTVFFLSFFTPDQKNDNLAKDNSIWKVYLDVGGKRYTGKATKIRKLYTDLITTYPYHNHWSTPYFVEFPIPTRDVEYQAASVTITGPLGSKSVTFKAEDRN